VVVTAAARLLRTRYLCSACGEASPKWQGRCPSCGEWNSLVEGEPPPRPGRAGLGSPRDGVRPSVVLGLDAVAGEDVRRRTCGIGEWDRVLGGGLVPGALILLGGDPGVGKSTLALQVARGVGSAASPALYCAGEESAAQLGMRAMRTRCAGPEVAVLAETDLDALLAGIESRRPLLAVVDSVQTAYDTAVPGAPGSISQVRTAVTRLLLCAKATGVTIVLVGHVTKEGAIAGPRTLEHMVDVVLYLEGERHGEYRLLRGVKNRFGTTDELGIFTMRDTGMEEAEAPGRAFLDEGSLGVPGNVLTVSCEGARPLAVEVQALSVETPYPVPRRTASGFDLGRLHLLLAVLQRRAGMHFGKSDVYVNAVGGVRLAEPAVDLAVALAIAASVRNRSLPPGCVAIGEVGLGGEIRRVRRLDQRLAEAQALGITSAILPASQASSVPAGMRCHAAASLSEALRLVPATPSSAA